MALYALIHAMFEAHPYLFLKWPVRQA